MDRATRARCTYSRDPISAPTLRESISISAHFFLPPTFLDLFSARESRGQSEPFARKAPSAEATAASTYENGEGKEREKNVFRRTSHSTRLWLECSRLAYYGHLARLRTARAMRPCCRFLLFLSSSSPLTHHGSFYLRHTELDIERGTSRSLMTASTRR